MKNPKLCSISCFFPSFYGFVLLDVEQLKTKSTVLFCSSLDCGQVGGKDASHPFDRKLMGNRSSFTYLQSVTSYLMRNPLSLCNHHHHPPHSEDLLFKHSSCVSFSLVTKSWSFPRFQRQRPLPSFPMV